MILGELNALYDRLERDPAYHIAPLGYSLQKISFRVVLTPGGELLAIQDARRKEGTRLIPHQMLVLGPGKPSGSGLNPCFLWDNTKYILGYTPDDDQERARRCFEAFRERHVSLQDKIQSPEYRAVCRFLRNWDPDRADEHDILAAVSKGFGVFQIQGNQKLVHEDQDVLRYWKSQIAAGDGSYEAMCLVTGDLGPVARVHAKVRGVSGGKSSERAIVGFNEPAYESYGLHQSYNAPVGENTAFRYVTALNALLDGPMREKHRIRLADTTVAFWTDRPTATEDIFAGFLVQGSHGLKDDQVQDEGTRRRLEAYLQAIRAARPDFARLEDDLEHRRYNLLGLAPNAARIAIRFHLSGTLRELHERLRDHYRDISIEPDRRQDGHDDVPSLRSLLDETCPWMDGRPDRDRTPPILAGPLMRSIFAGTPYPEGFYGAVMRRLRTERRLRRVRAGIIKGYLNRNRGKEVGMSLDVERTDVAYRLGRMFAVLEKTQADALGGDVNATVRDRFYASASATPRTVFPRLMRTYQHHLAKLSTGQKINREKLVQEIFDPLDGFPARFDLSDQGLFAIGYYHQTRAFYRKDPETTDNNAAERDGR